MGLYEGIRLTTLDLGPGHWPGTAMPGSQGNVVIAGHRVSKHQVFLRINELVVGDEIIFETDSGEVFFYVVTAAEVIEPTDLWIIDQTPKFTATLFACHPPGSTAQRYAVFATLVQ
jgi:sortase A